MKYVFITLIIYLKNFLISKAPFFIVWIDKSPSEHNFAVIVYLFHICVFSVIFY
jgi:hypothetical protein